ncbi:MAG: ATPase, T2SS/T4P/T4SS family [Armatimonadota bacterium]|nr:ATPase, T2SS/T4P/T4SS family [Armatimonadota bacterium]
MLPFTVIVGAWKQQIERKHLMSLEETGLPEIVEELTLKSKGLVLIVGLTCSGKTTTMYVMIDFINRERRCKIVTFEDPVEYYHENRLSVIVQQEVGTDVPSFSQALIQILRQAPDVICIGEMRDLETIATALLAIETGHLIIATLYTGHAAEKSIASLMSSRLTSSNKLWFKLLPLGVTQLDSRGG